MPTPSQDNVRDRDALASSAAFNRSRGSSGTAATVVHIDHVGNSSLLGTEKSALSAAGRNGDLLQRRYGALYCHTAHVVDDFSQMRVFAADQQSDTGFVLWRAQGDRALHEVHVPAFHRIY
jgi:hypothetical protein